MATAFDLGGLLGSAFGGDELGDFLTPEQRAAIQQRGLLSAAAALLQAGGPSRTPTSLGQALGAAFEAGQTGTERAQQSALTQILTRQKLEEARQEAAATQGFRSALESMRGGGAAPAMTPAQALAAPGLPAGPTVARAEMIGQPAPAGMGAPGTRVLTDAQIDLLKTLPRKEAAAELLKLTQPTPRSDKARLLDELGLPVTVENLRLLEKPEAAPEKIRTLQALGLQPSLENLRLLEKPEAAPEKIRMLQALGLQPTIENLRQLERPEASPSEIRILEATGTPVTLQNVMSLRRAGATTVNIPGNKEFVSGAASQAIKTLDEMTQNARAAVSTISTIERISPAIDTAVIGPAADYRTTMLRIGQQLGVAGQNETERLANTRTVVQGLAQLELEAAQQMRGQGALTEAERGILRRAAAGDQTLSAPELRSALATAKKVATARIEAQQDYLNRARKIEDFKPFAPLYEITAPSSGAAPSLLNLLDAEIQRRQQPQRGR
jgi:hypothetical protein